MSLFTRWSINTFNIFIINLDHKYQGISDEKDTIFFSFLDHSTIINLSHYPILFPGSLNIRTTLLDRLANFGV